MWQLNPYLTLRLTSFWSTILLLFFPLDARTYHAACLRARVCVIISQSVSDDVLARIFSDWVCGLNITIHFCRPALMSINKKKEDALWMQKGKCHKTVVLLSCFTVLTLHHIIEINIPCFASDQPFLFNCRYFLPYHWNVHIGYTHPFLVSFESKALTVPHC